MRFESSVTSVSWIPSEAVAGMTKLPFEVGIGHYDPPPPDQLGDLDALRLADRFRFANQLKGWVEVEAGHVVAFGQDGGGQIGSTTLKLGPKAMVFPAVAFPDLRPDPEASVTAVRFVQSAGGRTGVPAPRRVRRPPFVQMTAPLAWTSLSLTIRADGSSVYQVLGASPFPRHWIYDHSGNLVAKSGMIDFKSWYRTAFTRDSPWGGSGSKALITTAETALEREISATIMGGRDVDVRKVAKGKALVTQGEKGNELFVVLDGVLVVEVDGEPVAEVGPGAIVGERAILEGGMRTSTLRAVTPVKVAVAGPSTVDRKVLAEVGRGHRREEG
ncbi:MAG TPA: cyclic nucleotide-binding domain-containing protein [Actinomycetota bacterium]|nr:cyclic nucleotide-binding domain-containing protein [Actinomycetota bacterium]